MGDIVGPADDATNDGTIVPADVGNRRLAPGKTGVVVGANQRDILRHLQAPLAEMLIAGVEFKRFIENQSRRRGGATKKRIKEALKALLENKKIFLYLFLPSILLTFSFPLCTQIRGFIHFSLFLHCQQNNMPRLHTQ